jgi:hypothetical protein
MIKLYKVDNTKKSDIRGYWHNKNKLYKDNIKIIPCKDKRELSQGIKSLFDSGEIAVFYSIKNKGYIQNRQGKISRLNYRLRLHRQKLSVKEFKKLVLTFGGLTCYKLYNRYIIEVYHN